VLNREERRRAVELLQRLLAEVEAGRLTVDGGQGAALVRHLRGALAALVALDKAPPESPGASV